MSEKFQFGRIQYGTLVGSFSNGDIVVALTPERTYEIAITNPGQAFPIRTLEKDGKKIQIDSFDEAKERADKIYTHLLCEYGELPQHLVCSHE